MRFLMGLGFLALSCAACAGSKARETSPRYTVVKGEDRPAETRGLPPDKEAEVQLLLQQREVSTRRCYQDVLDERKDPKFAGSVKLVISLGTNGQATEVKPVGGDLGDKQVEACLVETIKQFEFPQLTQPGDVQYEFRFRPAY